MGLTEKTAKGEALVSLVLQESMEQTGLSEMLDYREHPEDLTIPETQV